MRNAGDRRRGGGGAEKAVCWQSMPRSQGGCAMAHQALGARLIEVAEQRYAAQRPAHRARVQQCLREGSGDNGSTMA